MTQPQVHEFANAPDVEAALSVFSSLSGCLLLDSSLQIASAAGHPLGRYSFLMADPFDRISHQQPTLDSLDQLSIWLSQFCVAPINGLPPMQGGVAGMFSYDFARAIERLPGPRCDAFKTPSAVLCCYDVVLAWDHQENKAWLISQGFPATEPNERTSRARQRLAYFLDLLQKPAASSSDEWAKQPELPREKLSPQYEVPGPPGLLSNFSRESYLTAAEKVIRYIYEGDIFQANLAQRLLLPASTPAIDLYRRLRTHNPSPFGSYFDFGGYGGPAGQLASASPERFASVRDGHVETRPIKGTRPRTKNPLVDIHLRNELESSTKDRAENIMIVDLMRNDLSLVCDDDSVRVSQLCEVENYPSVMHLVSAVEGKLKHDAGGSVDYAHFIRSLFPGGSITGAPKVRAMEIINELEPDARGAYCGSIGYFSFTGDADLNILIRTITASHGWWQIPVGGGIVSHSDPVREYEETWTKAAGLLHAAGGQ